MKIGIGRKVAPPGFFFFFSFFLPSVAESSSAFLSYECACWADECNAKNDDGDHGGFGYSFYASERRACHDRTSD
jgi:hypothetical protein